MTIADPPVVAINRFPTIVHADGQVYRDVRVVLTQPVDGVGEFYVWTAPEQVVIHTDYRLDDSRIGPNQADWFIATDAGDVMIQPSPGCGCGHPLKAWVQPFTPMLMGSLRR